MAAITSSKPQRDGLFSRLSSSPWKPGRKKLIDALAFEPAPNGSGLQPTAAVSPADAPPQVVPALLAPIRWAQKRAVATAKSLVDETRQLISQLAHPEAAIKPGRLWEVDLLRGATIGLMVLIHAARAILTPLIVVLRILVFVAVATFLALADLASPASKDATGVAVRQKWSDRRGLNMAALLAAWVFITGFHALILIELFAGIMGLSLALAYERQMRRTGQPPSFRQLLPRGLSLMAWGVSLALAFSLLAPAAVGLPIVLAELGLSLLLAYPLLRRSRWWSFSLGLLAIGLAAAPLSALPILNPFVLVWGGARSAGRYATILPWLGSTLLGVFVGKTLYDQGERRYQIVDISQKPAVRQLVVIGQHAELIFLLHLPVAFI